MSVSWINYFVPDKFSKLTEGHLPADKLYDKILKHNGDTAYCCYFDLDKSCLLNEDNRPTFKGYDDNICRPALNMVSFDFDHEKDPQNSLDDVRKFVEWLDVDDIAVFFSGSKGFHVMVPFGYFGLEPSKELPYILRDLSKHLKEVYPTLDTSIYNYNRKFRVPFSKHEKSGLYKSAADQNDSIERIREYSNSSDLAYDFLKQIEPNRPRTILPQIEIALQNCVKTTYEIDTSKSGTLSAPTPFEKYDNKSCIKRMLESRCDSEGRNNAALRIVNDFYRIGKTRSNCEKALLEWRNENNLPLAEITTIIDNIYLGKQSYNFGCQDDIKASYCTYKCSIYKKLDPDKRPEVVDMPETAFKEQEKSKMLKEFEVIRRILEDGFGCTYNDKKNYFDNDGMIIKQARDLFVYKNGYWKHLEIEDHDLIKGRIGLLYANRGDNNKIEKAFRSLLVFSPSVPKGVNMFNPNPMAANFKNGTLHLREDATGNFSLEFTEHNRLDYLTSVIEFDYSEDDIRNDMFEDTLERIFEGNEDSNDKVMAIQEMFGASLMPYFPHLFYLMGESRTGKSTIIMALRYMLGENKNICSVQPKHFGGFNLEIMVGKLVNMVTDLDTNKVIQDDVVKQIEDRVPFTIRRKNRTDLMAPLPAVHIFAGNAPLKSLDGATRAMDTRWTIIGCHNVVNGDKRRNFASIMFKHNPQGVLCFALKGLKRLIKNRGYFSRFKSDIEEINQWNSESDVVGQFLDEGFNGELDNMILFKNDESKIERKIIWKTFNEWQDDAGYGYKKMTKGTFYKNMLTKKYVSRKIKGVRYFKGLGESINAEGATNISDASTVI